MTPAEYEATFIAKLPERTGRTLEEWVDLVRSEGPPGRKERQRWLEREHRVNGVGRVTAWTIAYYAEKADGRSPLPTGEWVKREDPRIQIDSLGGACPVQGEGTVDGKLFYFRARHDEWSFAIALDPDSDPADIVTSQEGFYVEQVYLKLGREGAGHMPLEEAKEIIYWCAEQFLDGGT